MDAAHLEEKYNRELDEMTDEIQAGIQSGKFTLADIQQKLSTRAKEAATATNDLVRTNPWAAVGAAAVIGCLLGWIIRRD